MSKRIIDNIEDLLEVFHDEALGVDDVRQVLRDVFRVFWLGKKDVTKEELIASFEDYWEEYGHKKMRRLFLGIDRKDPRRRNQR